MQVRSVTECKTVWEEKTNKIFAWSEEFYQFKAEWNTAWMESGEPSVMTDGIEMMLLLCVASWDIMLKVMLMQVSFHRTLINACSYNNIITLYPHM